ncbi:MAG: hypothetical protein C0621_01930 [Desulfuromonas sp.]|nr:MAG: hypothetical protein C0621_01930 [Desulfuromonas sp.]
MLPPVKEGGFCIYLNVKKTLCQYGLDREGGQGELYAVYKKILKGIRFLAILRQLHNFIL